MTGAAWPGPGKIPVPCREIAKEASAERSVAVPAAGGCKKLIHQGKSAGDMDRIKPGERGSRTGFACANDRRNSNEHLA